MSYYVIIKNDSNSYFANIVVFFISIFLNIKCIFVRTFMQYAFLNNMCSLIPKDFCIFLPPKSKNMKTILLHKQRYESIFKNILVLCTIGSWT